MLLSKQIVCYSLFLLGFTIASQIPEEGRLSQKEETELSIKLDKQLAINAKQSAGVRAEEPPLPITPDELHNLLTGSEIITVRGVRIRKGLHPSELETIMGSGWLLKNCPSPKKRSFYLALSNERMIGKEFVNAAFVFNAYNVLDGLLFYPTLEPFEQHVLAAKLYERKRHLSKEEWFKQENMNWNVHFTAIFKADNPKLLEDMLNDFKAPAVEGEGMPSESRVLLTEEVKEFIKGYLIRLIYDYDAVKILKALMDGRVLPMGMSADIIGGRVRYFFFDENDEVDGDVGGLFRVNLGLLLDILTDEEIGEMVPLDDIDTIRYVLSGEGDNRGVLCRSRGICKCKKKRAEIVMRRAAEEDRVEILELLEKELPELGKDYYDLAILAAKGNGLRVFRWIMEKMKDYPNFPFKYLPMSWTYPIGILNIFMEFNPKWKLPERAFDYDATLEGVADRFLSLDPPVYPEWWRRSDIRDFDLLKRILEKRPEYKPTDEQINDAAKMGKNDFLEFILKRDNTFPYEAKYWKLLKWKMDHIDNYTPTDTEIQWQYYFF